MPGEDANQSPQTFHSMRDVVERLRATRAAALIELCELEQAVEEVQRNIQALLRAARRAHTTIERLTAMDLIGDEAAKALSRHHQAVISATEQVDSAIDQVLDGLGAWGIGGMPLVEKG